ncbi:MAG: hypothetical protein HXM14_01090 [Fusobacterium periodonticum]|nr:hypothetical protein [Fusobacterium periodonticum]
MKVLERTIQLYRKVDNNEPMEEMHKRVMEGLSKIEAPLGLKDSENPNFLKLKETGVQIGILSDALFTLFPVMYFNEECYKKLIKVPKEELLKRLEGKAKKVLLEKGIYIIFNDKADISYEEFVEMNETFKPLLNLI